MAKLSTSGLRRSSSLGAGRKVLRSFYLPVDLDEALQSLALRTQRTQTQVLTDLIRKALRAGEAGAKPGRFKIGHRGPVGGPVMIDTPLRITMAEGAKASVVADDLFKRIAAVLHRLEAKPKSAEGARSLPGKEETKTKTVRAKSGTAGERKKSSREPLPAS